jgi:RNA polymerase sigma-32 factor
MGYGLQMADLVQEGTVGLMKAVKRFDPNVGVRLVGFAVHWIKSEIHEFVIKNWRIVKVATTKPQRKLFFNLRGHKKKLAWFTKDEVESVAKDLGVSTKDVLEMESRLNAHDAVFDAPVNEDEDSYTYSPQQYLTDENSIGTDPLQALSSDSLASFQQEKLGSALQQLDARSLDIISSRYLVDKKVGLKVLAEKYGVSLERIRQIEKAGIESLKDSVMA